MKIQVVVTMTDEAHFHLSGFTNEKNVFYLAEENRHLLHQRPFHNTRVEWQTSES
jgi:hypothetical protein